MPRIAGYALRTDAGDLSATWQALRCGTWTPQSHRVDLIDELLALIAEACRETRPDALLLATTKGDCPRWLAGLLKDSTPSATSAFGPGALAAALGERLGCPAAAIQAACASSTTALGIAGRGLASGRWQRVVVVAADRLHDFIHDGFAALQAIDPNGCRPFDRDRAGLRLGEVRAAVLLTTANASDDRVTAQNGTASHLCGWGAAIDAVHLTAPDREAGGLIRACQAALQRAGCNTVDAIIAHGTGTRFNDDAESVAYHRLFPNVPVTASKGVLGHSLGAAGLADTILACEMQRRGWLLGSATTNTVGCAQPVSVLGPGEHHLPNDRLLIANAGFGGLDAAVIISTSPSPLTATLPPHADMVRRIRATAATWHRDNSDGTTQTGRFAVDDPEAGHLALPMARQVIDRIDASWGRMDAASRLLVTLIHHLGPLPDTCGIILWSNTGCAASDRQFESERLAGRTDPQRFPYTLASTPIGEAAIRNRVRGPGWVIACDDERLVRTLAAEHLHDGLAGVILARVEADLQPQVAWAELFLSEGTTLPTEPSP